MGIKNIIGERFGRLIVIKKTDNKDKSGHLYYECKCDCGKICQVVRSSLLTGRTTSCGCYKKELLSINSRIDISGQKFSHLTVIEPAYTDKSGHLIWKCQCDCENKTITYVSTTNLKTGNSTSCGCDRKSKGEKLISSLLKEYNIKYIQQWDNNKNFRYEDSNYPIKFDFFLPEYNCVIEFDGSQHNIGWNRDKKNLQYVKNHDNIKDFLCKENNIKMIRISYTDYNIITYDYIMNRIMEV